VPQSHQHAIFDAATLGEHVAGTREFLIGDCIRFETRHSIAVADAQIAAIAASRRFSVATCDEAPFLAAGVTVINPWTAAPGAE
jgi:predicted nucleic acid-binding protein